MLSFRADHCWRAGCGPRAVPTGGVAEPPRGLSAVNAATEHRPRHPSARPDLGRRLADAPGAGWLRLVWTWRSSPPTVCRPLRSVGTGAAVVTTWWPTSGRLGPGGGGGRPVRAGRPVERRRIILGVRAAVMVIGNARACRHPTIWSIYAEVDPRPGHTDADRKLLCQHPPRGSVSDPSQPPRQTHPGRPPCGPQRHHPRHRVRFRGRSGPQRCPNRDRGSTGPRIVIRAEQGCPDRPARRRLEWAVRIATWNINRSTAALST